MDKLRKDMECLCSQLLEDFGIQLFPSTMVQVPFVDLSETQDDLIIKAEVPGMDPKDLDITVTDDLLTIKGETRRDVVDEGENYRRTERKYGSFSRTFRLPCRVRPDAVEATYKKGILNIVMPKCKGNNVREIKLKVK
jgi:HSP20 family protein